jgi:AmmeMemoRadiSam system protein A
VLVFAGLAPHPPLIVLRVGGDELRKVEKTIRAMKQWAQRVAAAKPDTLVFFSPHGVFLRDAEGYLKQRKLFGSFAAFGSPEIAFETENDCELAEAIVREAAKERISVVGVDDNTLDHGIMVPLHYLREAGVQAKLVAFGISLLPFGELFRFGRVVARVCEATPRRIALVASGDLSHRLIPGAPAGYDPQGKVFDEIIQEALSQMDVERILNLPEDLVERAAECGLRPIIILLGALSGKKVESRIYSYEGPFGVGYLVAEFCLRGRGPQEDPPHVRLARASLEYYLRTGKIMPVPDPLPEGMEGRAGVFVSLKKRGQLRGCIGTVEPVRENIAAEIIYNAVSAGVGDPRFMPVQLEELPELEISVDVLTPPEPVASEKDLDPKRYGVIVSSKGRRGLLLPNLEGIDTVEEQIRIAKMKAGISPDEPVQLERFEVVRYQEGGKG